MLNTATRRTAAAATAILRQFSSPFSSPLDVVLPLRAPPVRQLSQSRENTSSLRRRAAVAVGEEEGEIPGTPLAHGSGSRRSFSSVPPSRTSPESSGASPPPPVYPPGATSAAGRGGFPQQPRPQQQSVASLSASLFKRTAGSAAPTVSTLLAKSAGLSALSPGTSISAAAGTALKQPAPAAATPVTFCGPAQGSITSSAFGGNSPLRSRDGVASPRPPPAPLGGAGRAQAQSASALSSDTGSGSSRLHNDQQQHPVSGGSALKQRQQQQQPKKPLTASAFSIQPHSDDRSVPPGIPALAALNIPAAAAAAPGAAASFSRGVSSSTAASTAHGNDGSRRFVGVSALDLKARQANEAAAAAAAMSTAAQQSVMAFARIRQEFQLQQSRRQAQFRATQHAKAAAVVAAGATPAPSAAAVAASTATRGSGGLPGSAATGRTPFSQPTHSFAPSQRRPPGARPGPASGFRRTPFAAATHPSTHLSSGSAGGNRGVGASLSRGGGRRGGLNLGGRASVLPAGKRISIDDETTVRDLALRIGVKVGRLVAKLEDVGESVRAEGFIEPEIAEFIVNELGMTPVLKTRRRDRLRTPIPSAEAAAAAGLPPRAPVITVMGHVDHGKTTLMDALRGSNVAEREAGGITQGIAAFSVPMRADTVGTGDRRAPGGKAEKSASDKARANRKTAAAAATGALPPNASTTASAARADGGPSHADVMTFLDTPGHALFSSMRRRGTAVTDVVVLVVDGKDGVMPQTKECVKLILGEGEEGAPVPCIVAVTKCDLVDSARAVESIASQLLALGLVTEAHGGDAPILPISAKTGAGLGALKDAIALQAEMLDLRAACGEDAPGEAVILDARAVKGMGIVVDGIVRWGRLAVGDIVVAGTEYGRVKSILTDAAAAASLNAGRTGKPAALPSDAAGAAAAASASSALYPVPSAVPGTPVRVLGLGGVPPVGEDLLVVESEERAKDIVEGRLRRAQTTRLKEVAAADAVRRAGERRSYKEKRQRKLAYESASARQRKRSQLEVAGIPVPPDLAQQPWEALILQAGVEGRVDGFSAAGRKLRVQGDQQLDVTLTYAQASSAASTVSAPLAVPAGASRKAVASAAAAFAIAQEAAAAAASSRPAGPKAIAVILKCDSAGSLLAVSDGLARIPSATSEVCARVVHSGVGEVSEKDVELAADMGALVVAWNAKVSPAVAKSAERRGVKLISGRVIYHVLDAVCAALSEHMSPGSEEETVAAAEVKAVFDIKSKKGDVSKVAGCVVVEGTFLKSGMTVYRVLRGPDSSDTVASAPSLASLMHLKDKVESVAKGSECGMALSGDWADYAVGDRIVAVRVKSVKPKLVVRYD